MNSILFCVIVWKNNGAIPRKNDKNGKLSFEHFFFIPVLFLSASDKIC